MIPLKFPGRMRRLPLAFLVLFLAWPLFAESPEKGRAVPGAGLFSGSAIRKFTITVEEPEFTKLKQDNRKYVRATISDGQEVYKDVGIHLKGMGSFQPLEKKPSLVVKFDYENPRQRYEGLSKFMLNNASQDGTYLAEYMGTSLFRDAGLPAVRVTHAYVVLNGRDLGPYVVMEPMNKEFLGQHFRSVRGNLYEAYLHDVDQPMEQDNGKVSSQEDMKALAAAAKETDPLTRWQRLEEVLAVDQFIKYLILEILTAHTDGYGNNFNNYRIYHDTDTERLHFITHGIDWAFQSTGYPIRPPARGLVARAVLATPEGRKRFKQYLPQLYTNVFRLDVLTNRVNTVEARLKAVARNSEEAKMFANGAIEMRNRLVQRHKFIGEQLALPEPKPVYFGSSNEAKIGGWASKKDTGDPVFDRPKTGETNTLHINGNKGPCVASWRTRLVLPEGKYKFMARARASGVEPQPSDETGIGAGIRISGGKRQAKLVGDSDWATLDYDFDIMPGGDEVELVAELRAKKGEVWFERGSMKLVKLK
jgi:spore coat protein H